MPSIIYLRSSHQRCSMKKGVLKNFTKFTGKHLCQSLFFNKVAGLRPAALLKKRLWHRCFPVNFVKFLRTPFLQNTSGGLLMLLKNQYCFVSSFISCLIEQSGCLILYRASSSFHIAVNSMISLWVHSILPLLLFLFDIRLLLE